VINDSNIGGMSGAPVHGPDDRKIGTVGQVFVDPDTGMPNWITVHTGLFGRRESFVPLDGATWDNEVIRVAIDKDTIKDAPRIDADEPLSAENEAGLYRYYTLQATDAAAGDGGTAPVTNAATNTASDTVPGPRRSRLRQYQRPAAAGGHPDAAPASAGPEDESVRADTASTDLTADEAPSLGGGDAPREPELGAVAQSDAAVVQPRGRHVKPD
jgi:PRC-barrel domain